MKSRLKSITLRGFKSIQDLHDFEPRSLTVLIGPNGVGKSNFIAFFRMIDLMLSGREDHILHVSLQGGGNNLLYGGAKITQEIEAKLAIQTDKGEIQYSFRLAWAAGDTLIFASEKYRFLELGHSTSTRWTKMGPGHRSPELIDRSLVDPIARVIREILQRISVYQFHDTAYNSLIRGRCSVEDNRSLKGDARNIAPFLLRIREREGWHYRRIVESIRLILPFFFDFELESKYGKVLLAWRERGNDQIFYASQASDGMLRIIALISLLLQPEESLPDVLILDEPELGLHPYAITIVGGLINTVAKTSQVIVATQSTALVDCFTPEDIVVVERDGQKSDFKHLDSEKLAEWLEEYSLSELWEKNVLGGQP